MSRNETANEELEGQFPNEIIRASAGTGKTFELSNRYLRLLASGTDSNSILATTFTRKGAGEILDRIVARLSAAALDESSAKKLSEEMQWMLSTERAAAVLKNLLRSLHRLEIGTLDSFFNRFAKAFSLELGLPATWEIVEQQQIERLQDVAIQEILGHRNTANLLHLMSHGEATRRIATEIRATVGDLYEVFCETTPDAWEQIPRPSGLMDDDELAAFVDSMEDVEVPDLSSWQKAWAKLQGDLIAKRYGDIVKAGIVGAVIAGKEKYNRREIPPAIREVAQRIKKHCAADLVNGVILRNIATRDLLQLFQDKFEPLKSSTGQLRFQDITRRLADFVDQISAEGMTFRLDNQIRHLLLDEFQDTSPVQWSVMAPFAKRVTETDDAQHSFFCVGDVKQAIFGWRGGAAEIFGRAEDDLTNLAQTEPRTKSYRSSQPVIDFVNHVFQNLARFTPDPDKHSVARQAVHQWQDWFQEHETARTELEGCSTVELAEPVSKDDGSGKLDSKESLYQATTNKVLQLNELLPDDLTIGVLVRTNAEIGEYIFRLRQEGIEASEEGGNPLTDSAAVEIVLAAIKLADSPGDSLARFRVSHSPLAATYGIDPQTESNGAECRRQGIAASVAIRRQLVTDGYGATIEQMARTLAPHGTAREITRLQQLVQIAYASESNRDVWQLRPSRFVAYIRDEYRAVAPSAARIRVMTVHAAKGLEFDAVVLPLRSGQHDRLAGQPPTVVTGRDQPTAPIKVITRHVGKSTQALLPKSVQELFDQHDVRVIREAMCLLYVALTRAVHATHIILGPDVKRKSASAASVVFSTLSQDDPNVEDTLIVHEAGNLNWYEAQTDADEEATNLSKLDGTLSEFYLPANATLERAAISSEVSSGRGLANRYPSEKDLTTGSTFGDRLLRPQNRRAANIGSLLHACFEQTTWWDEHLPSNETFANQLQRLEPDSQIIQQVIKSFRKVLSQPGIAALLTEKSYVKNNGCAGADAFEVMTEHRFAVATPTGILSGSIDRLVLHLKNDQVVAAEVIDYKSDHITAAQVIDRIERYRGQMDAYREAVCQTFGISNDQVTQTIVFTSLGTVQSLNAAGETGSTQTQTTLW